MPLPIRCKPTLPEEQHKIKAALTGYSSCLVIGPGRGRARKIVISHWLLGLLLLKVLALLHHETSHPTNVLLILTYMYEEEEAIS